MEPKIVSWTSWFTPSSAKQRRLLLAGVGTMSRNEPDASIQHNHLVVRLPLWQILSLVALGCFVVFSVWLTTRDLGTQVGSLQASVERLSKNVSEFNRRASNLSERIIRLETIHRERSRGSD